MQFRGRVYNSRAREIAKKTKNCNSFAFVDWGEETDIKNATVCAIRGFWRIQINDDVFYFAGIRTLLEYKSPCVQLGVRKVDITKSPSRKAAEGEVVQISQLHVACVPVLLPVTAVLHQGRHTVFSASNTQYYVCPVFS